MSKYGFAEKEIRKTIVTMIDKDGFHNEFVVNGQYHPDEPADFKIGYECNPNAKQVAVLMLNVPVDRDIDPEEARRRMYTFKSAEDTDWVRNIGDLIGEYPYDGANWGTPFAYYPKLNAAADILFMSDAETTSYYQVYILNEDLQVIDRKKITIIYDETSGD